MPRRSEATPGNPDSALRPADSKDLAQELVRNRLARIYGTRTTLYDGKDSRKYLARLAELEAQAKRAKRGAWRFVK
jgi:endonuclease YncB( thermonuclease family)